MALENADVVAGAVIEVSANMTRVRADAAEIKKIAAEIAATKISIPVSVNAQTSASAGGYAHAGYAGGVSVAGVGTLSNSMVSSVTTSVTNATKQALNEFQAKARNELALALREGRRLQNESMATDMRRLNQYGSPSNSYGSGMSAGPAGGGGGDIEAGGRGGLGKSFKMVTGTALRASGLGGQLGAAAGLAADSGALAAPVAAAVLLGMTISKVVDQQLSLVTAQREYNDELGKSARHWKDIAAGEVSTTTSGSTFMSQSAEARERGFQKKAALQAKFESIGLLDAAGSKLDDLMSGGEGSLKRETRLQIKSVKEDWESAKRLRAAAEAQEPVFRERRATDRDTELRTLQGQSTRDPLQSQQRAIEAARDEQLKSIGRAKEDSLTRYDVGWAESVKSAKIEDVRGLWDKRDVDRAKIEEEAGKDEEQAKAMAQEKLAQLQQKFDVVMETRGQQHGLRIVEMKAESNRKGMELQNQFAAAEVQGIEDTYNARINTIRQKLKEELATTTDVKARQQMEGEAAENEQAARDQRDAAKRAADKKQLRTREQVVGSAEFAASQAELRFSRKDDKAALAQFDRETLQSVEGMDESHQLDFLNARERQRKALTDTQSRDKGERDAGYSTRQAMAAAAGKGQGELAGTIGRLASMDAELRNATSGDEGQIKKSQLAELKSMQNQMLMTKSYATEWDTRNEVSGGPGGDAGAEQLTVLKLINEAINKLVNKEAGTGVLN